MPSYTEKITSQFQVEDPLIGLFSGSPDLATKAEEILEQELNSISGLPRSQALPGNATKRGSASCLLRGCDIFAEPQELRFPPRGEPGNTDWKTP